MAETKIPSEQKVTTRQWPEAKDEPRLQEVDEPKAKRERKKVPVGIFEATTIPQHGVVYKSAKDQTGKDLTFKDSKDADKWLTENAKEGDNDKVYLIAPRRLVTVRAKRQLKISVER